MPIDWSKAGKRLRHTPRAANSTRNPDWNWEKDRWKVAEEYAADELDAADVFEKVECPRDGCLAFAGYPCRDARDQPMEAPHAERRFAAGAALIAEGWKL